MPVDWHFLWVLWSSILLSLLLEQCALQILWAKAPGSQGAIVSSLLLRESHKLVAW